MTRRLRLPIVVFLLLAGVAPAFAQAPAGRGGGPPQPQVVSPELAADGRITFRILAPLFPLLGAFALPRARWYRWGLVVLFLAFQVGWLLICWGIDGLDWTPP